MTTHTLSPAGWTVDIAIPEGWTWLDAKLPSADRRGRLVAGLDDLVAQFPEMGSQAAILVEMGEAMSIQAIDHGALFFALGFHQLGLDMVTMSLAGYGLFGEQLVDLDVLVAELGVARPTDVEGRDVEIIDLPVGPSVRVHAISEGGPPDEQGRTLYVEGLDYFIPVPGGADMLLLCFETPSLAAGDLLLPHFEQIAASVGIEPSDPRD